MTILVVEDDRDIREMVCQSLAQSDYQRIGCRNLQEARQSMENTNPDSVRVNEPVPAAPVVTGGTSCSPAKVAEKPIPEVWTTCPRISPPGLAAV